MERGGGGVKSQVRKGQGRRRKYLFQEPFMNVCRLYGTEAEFMNIQFRVSFLEILGIILRVLGLEVSLLLS